VTVATKRRRFDPATDARRFVFLLDEDIGVLFEVVGVRGSPTGQQPAANAAVKLLDVRPDLPDDPFDALDRASWLPIEEATCLAVVVPMPQTAGRT
jgi:hypothetical protein